ncbi:MFS transporter [Amycolatopsis orientalis]|uniref:MFS transporter n=1 Tax=Amycolatopsis orientalis TaxID=31958 RepID=UPI00068818F9|nr:MFS transporter [Amycolatopsis orientalis]
MSAVRLSPPSRRLLLPIVLSGTFVQLFSVTVMQVGVVDVQRDLRAGAAETQLVLAAYTLTYACSLIVSARLGDKYGYRRMFVTGMALFTAASIGAAAAPDAWVLIAARALQGFGSGLMAPQILSIIQSAVPADRRPAALSAFGATMAAASLAGPVLGGVLTQLDPLGLGWRAAMLAVVPVGIAALAFSPALPSVRGGREPQRVDPAGAALSLLGFALLVFPLAMGRETGWLPWTWASLALAAASLTGFVHSQRRAADPLVQPSTWSEPATRRGLVAVLVFNAGVPSFTLLLSMHLQAVKGWSPLQTGLSLTPYAVGALAGSRIAGNRRLGPRALAASSLAMGLVSVAVPVLLGDDDLLWLYWLALCAGGVAFGVFTASAFTRIIARARPEAATSVSGLLPTAQQLGGTLGVTFAGMAYAAPAATASGALWHGMTYEATVFAFAAALCAIGGRTATRPPAAVLGGEPVERGDRSRRTG